MRQTVSLLGMLAVFAVPLAALGQELPAGQRGIAQALVTPDEAVCLRGELLSPLLETWLARSWVDSRLQIVVSETAEGSAGFVVLEAEEAVASRTFTNLPAACPERRAAFSLAIAIAIDEAVLTDLVPLSSRPEPEPEPAIPESVPDVAPELSLPEPDPPQLAIFASAAGGVAFGVFPDPVLAFEFSAGMTFPSTGLSLRLGGLGTTGSSSAVEGGTVEARLAAGFLLGCLDSRLDTIAYQGCLGVGAGAVPARGEGFTIGLEHGFAWVSALARLAVSFPADSPLRLELHTTLLAGLVRPAFQILNENGDLVHSQTLPPVGIIMGLGPRFDFF